MCGYVSECACDLYLWVYFSCEIPAFAIYFVRGSCISNQDLVCVYVCVGVESEAS